MASYDLLVALLSDPVEVIESVAQQVNDEYDKNGLVFYVGSILADIAITKGTSKVIKATKAGSVAEDVAKFSDDVPKYYDDLDNGMKGLDNADEVKPCDGAGGVTGKGGTSSRPTWRQSEVDAAKDFPDYDAQKSFINGEEVPYGTKGSVRPDYYKNGYSVDIKNCNVESASGRSNLARNIEK